MGNFCVPKKIEFTKINSNLSINTVSLSESFQRIERKSFVSDSLHMSLKEAIMESVAISKEPIRRRFSMLSNDSILVSRHGSFSNDQIDNNSTDSAPDTFTNTSVSSRASSPISAAGNGSFDSKTIIDRKEKLINRFIKMCFTKQNHSDSQIKAITRILEYASRNNFADIIDFRNDENNTAISVAIIENNYLLLQCLMRFIPDFPEYIQSNNYTMPLVQAAAISNYKSQEEGNMLSIILKKWKDDSGYFDVALRNIIAQNSNFETLFEFLISQIILNSQRSRIHFDNLELLFQLYKVLQLQGMLTVTTHSHLSHLCSIISANNIFWTEERRQYLLRAADYEDYRGDYINTVFSIYERTN